MIQVCVLFQELMRDMKSGTTKPKRALIEMLFNDYEQHDSGGTFINITFIKIVCSGYSIILQLTKGISKASKRVMRWYLGLMES